MSDFNERTLVLVVEADDGSVVSVRLPDRGGSGIVAQNEEEDCQAETDFAVGRHIDSRSNSAVKLNRRGQFSLLSSPEDPEKLAVPCAFIARTVCRVYVRRCEGVIERNLTAPA